MNIDYRYVVNESFVVFVEVRFVLCTAGQSSM